MSLIISGLNKTFTGFPALKDVSLEAASGEFIALLGPSGSGKTTLLRLLAGLDRPDKGEITFEGEDYLRLNPRDRRVGMVFQSYALFRHMTVAQNIAFGLDVRPRRERPQRSEIKQTVDRLLELIQMRDLGKRYPSQLSGGQRQRVALARALAINPRLLLLDEPFGALDALVRKDLRRWLKRIHLETGVTTIFVTHDQEEALDLADRVVILRHGQVEQIGSPLAIHSRPATAFVFDFLGSANQVYGKVENGIASFAGVTAPVVDIVPNGAYMLRFRPFEVDLSHGDDGIPVTVSAVLPAGMTRRLELTGNDGTFYETQHPHGSHVDNIALGETCKLVPLRVFAYPVSA